MKSSKTTLFSALSTAFLAAGCAITPIPPQQHPPHRLPFPVDSTFTASASRYESYEAVTLEVVPARSRITEEIAWRDVRGRRHDVTRSASDGYRTPSVSDNYEHYYYESWDSRRPEIFAQHQREQMTVEQTKERQRLRSVYNSVLSKAPRLDRHAPHDTRIIRCAKPSGAEQLTCKTQWQW